MSSQQTIGSGIDRWGAGGKNRERCERGDSDSLFFELRDQQDGTGSIHGNDSGRNEAARGQFVRAGTGDGAHSDVGAFAALAGRTKMAAVVPADLR